MGGTMSIVLQGSTSGSITLQEPAVAGSNTINLPAATGTAVLTGVSGTVDINAAGSNIVTLSTNSTERMRITSGGDLLVGTTSSSGKVTVVNTNNANNALKLQSTTSGDVGQQQLFIAKFDNNSTTSQVFVRFSINNDTTASGQINANGASAVAFGTWSDVRLKENIEDLPFQLQNICSLRPVEFDYKAGGHQIGFIAQEMQQVYPDAVGEDSEGMLTVTGWSKTEARLVKAIQELKSIVDTQATKIAELEAKLEGTA